MIVPSDMTCVCWYYRMRARCGASCTSGSSMMGEEGFGGCPPATPQNPHAVNNPPASAGNTPSNQPPDSAQPPFPTRGSLVSTTSSAGKPSGFVSLAGLIAESGSTPSKEAICLRVQVCQTSYCNIITFAVYLY